MSVSTCVRNPIFILYDVALINFEYILLPPVLAAFALEVHAAVIFSPLKPESSTIIKSILYFVYYADVTPSLTIASLSITTVK